MCEHQHQTNCAQAVSFQHTTSSSRHTDGAWQQSINSTPHLSQRACADPVCCWSPLNRISVPFPLKNKQMGRVRVRQHVNPLASQFQRPAPSVDWAQVYQDPTRPLFVVSAAATQEATAAGAWFNTGRAAVAAQHLQNCVSWR